MVRYEFDPELFSDRLRQAIKANGMSQRAVAKAAGCTVENLNKMTRGKIKLGPSAYWLVQIATALNVSADWLIGLTGKEDKT